MEDATALALRSTSSTSASGMERMVIAPRAEKSREEGSQYSTEEQMESTSPPAPTVILPPVIT